MLTYGENSTHFKQCHKIFLLHPFKSVKFLVRYMDLTLKLPNFPTISQEAVLRMLSEKFRLLYNFALAV
jgi:hypothetical protein